MEGTHELESIPDDELLRRLAELLRQSRRVEADLVAHIGEVDSRRLYARLASPSMFAYSTEVLHLSEAEAYLRIAVARASREHPILLAMLADGRLHLTAIAKLTPHLTHGNREALLKRAAHKSRRQIEELVAELAPRPDAPAVMRKLPERRAQTSPVAAPEVGLNGTALALELRTDGLAVADTASPRWRCAAREGLEFHHRHPFGRGGDHSLENIALVCRAHNAQMADVDYGRGAMALHRRSRESVSEPTLLHRREGCGRVGI